jgi:hypothetical protein
MTDMAPPDPIYLTSLLQGYFLTVQETSLFVNTKNFTAAPPNDRGAEITQLSDPRFFPFQNPFQPGWGGVSFSLAKSVPECFIDLAAPPGEEVNPLHKVFTGGCLMTCKGCKAEFY